MAANHPITPVLSLDYIAGFFDGEGSVGIYTRKIPQRGTQTTSLRVTLANTNLIPLLEIHRRFGGYITRRTKRKAGTKYLTIFILTWRFGEGVEFLRKIVDRLVVKKNQANLAIEFWDWQHTKREDRCARVTRRGSGGAWVRTPETLAKEQSFVDLCKAEKYIDMNDIWTQIGTPRSGRLFAV